MKIAIRVGRDSLLWKVLLVLAAIIILTVWLAKTPDGLLGKADAIGYAVCHRIDARSFHLGDRQFPLCARCSGMYLGALLGLVYQLVQGRRGSLPSTKTNIFLGLLVVAFGIDGANSFLHFFPNVAGIYTPANWSRLVTGTGMGIAMSAMLMPTFHQTVWKTWDTRPALGSFRQIGGLVALSALLVVIILAANGNAVILFPLSLLSSLSVLVILSMVYTMILIMLARADNTFEKLRQIWMAILGGFCIALLQIALFDLVRFLATGTWGGFNLPG
jgi:uncharacterized membrane protein